MFFLLDEGAGDGFDSDGSGAMVESSYYVPVIVLW